MPELNETVYIPGMSTSEGVYVLEGKVTAISSQQVIVSVTRKHRRGLDPWPHSEELSLPLRYFDKSYDERLEQILDEARWIKEQFQPLNR